MLTETLTLAQTEAAALMQQLGNANSQDAQIVSLTNQVATLIVERDQNAAALAPLTQQLSDANALIATLQSNGTVELMSRVSQLEFANNELSNEASRLRQELADLNARIDAAQNS